MFKVDRQTKTMTRVRSTTLAEAKLLECQDLQAYIAQNFDAFADEIDELELRLIGTEFPPSKVVSDRIDLLAIDKDGTAVVLELKRAKHKFQLIQALAYAAMVAKLKRDEIISHMSQANTSEDLGENAAAFNREQRVILVAEEYDYEVLATAEWLGEHDIDVKCVRVAVSHDLETNVEYLHFTVVFPPAALEDAAKLRRAKAHSMGSQTSESWDAAIATTNNDAVKSFFRTYLDRGQESRLAYRTLHFRIGDSRRFSVGIVQDAAGVEQIGRFIGDLQFWEGKLDKLKSGLRVVFGGSRLRFRLQSPQDFASFTSAIERRSEG